MTREEEFDWLYRLRSEIYVYMPKEWIIPMNNALDMAIKALEQEPKYCDRNICVSNEYNGIGCDECEVTKSQEPKTGHWIDHDKHIECDKCRTWFLKDYLIRKSFCPNCGARMVDPQESEKV